MAQDLAKKLLLHKVHGATLVNAPDDFITKLQNELPEHKILTDMPKNDADFIHLFVHDSSELKNALEGVYKHLKPDGILWVSYPKKSSKLKSDLSRDLLQSLLRETNYEGVSLISIDETWSAMRVKPMKVD
ncbi:hypothetical protein ACHOLT_11310 [Desulfitobacterium sp. Sab5]|uniref:hypothetical protein n=1 Tax=Desulfitobacterium nosdiversum TaxID=3375356 RepID=UPI003CF56C84